MTSLPFEKRKKLCIKEYYDKSDPIEKPQDFRNVDNAWKNINLVAYTSTLKIGAGIVVLVIEPTPKPEDNTVLLTETVKECSS
ncbi:2757_t:CDS:2, partial [Scutellospora calospora]